jgi:hypothetical protein
MKSLHRRLYAPSQARRHSIRLSIPWTFRRHPRAWQSLSVRSDGTEPGSHHDWANVVCSTRVALVTPNSSCVSTESFAVPFLPFVDYSAAVQVQVESISQQVAFCRSKL